MATIEVLAGVAGTGKTTQLLELYRTALRQATERRRPGSTLWLSPSQHSVRDIQSRLVGESFATAFQPNVMRFDEFATRILERLPAAVVRVSGATRRGILRQIVERRLAARRLRHFEAIARTGGFLDLVTSFISEMKRGEIWPEHFAGAAERAGRSGARDRELAGIYADYQDVLRERHLYDAEGSFWSARDAISRGVWAPFGDFSLVVVDGFTDFLQTQYEILESLAGRAERMVVSLPLERDAQRPDLFAKPSDVLARLEQRCPLRIVHVPSPKPAESPRAAFRRIAEHLFCNPRLPLPACDAQGVEIVAAAGPQGERQALAARIKTLLREKARPNDIVVILRGLQDADLLVEQFVASGIPIACDVGQPLHRAPPLRALLTVLRLEAEDWPFERLAALMGSNYFRPQWPDMPWKTAARETISLLRRLKLSTGREAILAGLSAEATFLKSRWEQIVAEPAGTPPETGSSAIAPDTDADGQHLAELTHRRESVERALMLLKRIDVALSMLRIPQALPEWAAALGEIARDLGLKDSAAAAADRVDDADRIAWDAFGTLLREISRAESILGGSPRTLSLPEFLGELTDWLQQAAIGTPHAGEGRVRILDAEHVRNLDVPYLFVAGLTEDSFPRGGGDDCLLDEHDRQLLIDAGLTVRHRERHQQEEMLLFYGVVTRATRELVLSYPAVGSDGQPLSASPYLAAIQDLFPTLKEQLDERLDPVPQRDRVLTAGDVRVFAMHEALGGNPGLFAGALATRERSVAAINTLAALDMAAARFREPGFSQFEGQLRNPRNLREISQRLGPEHEFSTSQLEAYAACPFRFLASQVYGLQERESPDLRTDQALRGTVLHDLLARLHEQLRDESDSSGSSPDGQGVARVFQSLLAEYFDRRPGSSDLQKALLAIERRLLADWGRQYGQQWDDYVRKLGERAGTLRPQYFEAEFGRPTAWSQPQPQSPREPLVLTAGDQEIRIGGRIDRIDVSRAATGAEFNVIDYKSGATIPSVSLEKLALGQSLQLVLYALAVQRLGLAGPDAVPVLMGYWALKDNGFRAVLSRSPKGYQPLSKEVWHQLRQAVEAIVPRLAAGMRGGQFPVHSHDAQCTSHCAYRTTCRVAQIRALPEEMAKTWEPPGI